MQILASACFIVIGFALGWYALVLITAEFTTPFPIRNPTRAQLYALGFAFILGLCTFASRYFVLHNEE